MPRARLERAACRVGADCSLPLSYRGGSAPGRTRTRIVPGRSRAPWFHWTTGAWRVRSGSNRRCAGCSRVPGLLATDSKSGPRRIRTLDLRFWRPLLCRLSYGPKRADEGTRTPDLLLTKEVLLPPELRRQDRTSVLTVGAVPRAGAAPAGTFGVTPIRDAVLRAPGSVWPSSSRLKLHWWPRQGSNLRPSACRADVLPTAPRDQVKHRTIVRGASKPPVA